MSSDKKSSGAGKFALGAAIGTAVGGGAGILTAPKSGKETRQDVARKAREVKKAAGDKAGEAKAFAGEKVRDAKKFFGQKKEELDDKIDSKLDD